LTDEKLLAVAQSARGAESDFDFSRFNSKERLVIELADAMANTPANISDELYARLKSEFSEEQLLELGAHIAFENYRARYNRAFDVESDNLYHPDAGA
jgi:alkylhydroperoxidase family enzyme